MEIRFTKLSPTKNVTVLVETDVPRGEQPGLAARLLEPDVVGGEQVGFLETPSVPSADARLQMMGGEFCGNASMSVGALLAWKSGLPDGAQADYALEVSGAERLVHCHIERTGDAYRGTVDMPLPRSVGAVEIETDRGPMTVPMVDMSGIVHLIAGPETGLEREEIERRIRDWNCGIGADALGVLRFDGTEGRIEPLVYVPSTGTAVWECGCGSGSAAVGSWKAVTGKRTCSCSIVQPGGKIGVHAEYSGNRLTGLTITGVVRITARGTAWA